MKKIVTFFIVLITLFPSLSFAEIYYLRADGSASNKGNATGPCGSRSKTMNLSTHNRSTFSAGDVIKVCDDSGGFYKTEFIPPSSGSKENYITYKAEEGDTPVFKDRLRGVDLTNGQDSLKFVGLTFKNSTYGWASLGSGSKPRNDYIWFDRCTFSITQSWYGIFIDDSDHGRITNCNFLDAPVANNCKYWDSECTDFFNAGKELPNDCDCASAPADVIGVRLNGASAHYWIIEGNTFGNSSHASINMHDGIKYSVIRNNKFRNKWHANIGAGQLNNTPTERSYILVENNDVKGAGIDKITNPQKRDRTDVMGQGVGLVGNYAIVRNNKVTDSDWGLALLGYRKSFTNQNRIYFNTFYNNYMEVFQTGNCITDFLGNVLINNLFFHDSGYLERNIHNSVYKDRHAVIFNFCDLSDSAENLYINNAFPKNSNTFYFKNTRFINRTLDQVIAKFGNEWKESNFSISNSNDSLLEDSGAWLTTIKSESGKVTKFIVNDPNYFYDGWGIPGEVGDKIKTENRQIADIRSINYETGLITVSSPIDVINGEGISLIYSGNAPDIGANERGTLIPPILKIAENNL